MVKLPPAEVLFQFFLEYAKNPRVRTSILHDLHSLYKSKKTTALLLKGIKEKQIIVGPFIYCNLGIEVEIKFQNEVEDPIGLLDECKNDPEVTRAVALCGEHSFICFRKGASLLTYAEAIRPTLNSGFKIGDMELKEKKKLPVDPYPHGWDELDWEIYHMMRNPRISFAKVSGKLKSAGKSDVTWKTIETRYKRVLNDCKIWISFFPNGYENYSQTFLTFKTEYETEIRRNLQNLDRTTFLYKIGDIIMLNLFLDNNIEHRIFLKLKKEGLIHDLHVSIPLHFRNPFRF